MIDESLEMMVTRMARKSQRPIHVEANYPLEWRINKGFFTYFPEVSNRSVDACIKLARISNMVYVIVPEGIEVPMKHCLDCVTHGRRPMVETLPDFVQLRLLFHQLEMGWDGPASLAYLVRAYNRRISDAGLNKSLRIKLPRPPRHE